MAVGPGAAATVGEAWCSGFGTVDMCCVRWVKAGSPFRGYLPWSAPCLALISSSRAMSRLAGGGLGSKGMSMASWVGFDGTTASA